MANHPVTGEWLPPTGFPRLPEPDGRELRSSMSGAALLKISRARLSQLASEHDLTVYTSKINGASASYFLLEELLELKAKRANFQLASTKNTVPTEFTLKKARGEK